MKYDVMGIGNPLVDMLLRVNDNFFMELNMKKGTTHFLSEEELKKVQENIKDHEIKIAPGDSTANTLAGIANLGGKVVFSGKVGEDEHGGYYEETLDKASVSHRLAKIPGITGKCISFITPDTERTFAVHLGACLQLMKEDIFEEDIKNSSFLHLTGYQLEDPQLRETALHAMDIAKANNVKISIDLADPSLIRRCLANLLDIVKTYADILFVNETEAKALTGLEPVEAVNELANYCEIAIVKIGKEGSLVKAKEMLYKIQGYPVKAIDTTGAGDMYAAGFLFGLIKGYELDKCGKIGSYAASLIVQILGARLEQKIDLKEII